MAAYFDSSVLLSLVLGDTHAERAHQLWNSEFDRVSSLLIELECLTVLRRVPMASWSQEAAEKAEARLQEALQEISIKRLDEEVASVLRNTPALGGCRTLDAIHLATALFFRSAADDELSVCTFDVRMAEFATRVGLKTLGLV